MADFKVSVERAPGDGEGKATLRSLVGETVFKVMQLIKDMGGTTIFLYYL